MKKLFNLLIILLIIYFGLEISFINLNKGHNIDYKIKKGNNTFNIKFFPATMAIIIGPL